MAFYHIVIILLVKFVTLTCGGTIYLDHLKSNPSAGGDFEVASRSNLTNTLDLNCTEFDSACHWHNLKDESVSLKWFQSAAYLDPTFFRIATGASILPNGNYAVAANDDPSNFNASATLMSDVITCPGGTDGFSFMYWLSPKVELTICIKSVAREYPDYDFCTELPLSMSPGPIKVVIPAFNNSGFQVFITASNFTSDDGDFQGGFAVLDNITFLPQNCSMSPTITETNISNTANPTTAESGLTTVMGTLATEAITTLLPIGTVLTGAGTTMPTTIPITGTNNDSAPTVAPSWGSRPAFPTFSIPTINEPNNLPGSPVTGSAISNETIATALPSLSPTMAPNDTTVVVTETSAIPLPLTSIISVTGFTIPASAITPSMGTTNMSQSNSSTLPIGTPSNVTGSPPTPGKVFELNSTALWPTLPTVAAVSAATSLASSINTTLPIGTGTHNESTTVAFVGSSVAPLNASAAPLVTGLSLESTVVTGITIPLNSTGMPITALPSSVLTTSSGANVTMSPAPTGMIANGTTIIVSIVTTPPPLTMPQPNGPLPTIFMNPMSPLPSFTNRATGSPMTPAPGISVSVNPSSDVPVPMNSSVPVGATGSTMPATVTGSPLTPTPSRGFELNSTGMIMLPTTAAMLTPTGAPMPMNSSVPTGSVISGGSTMSTGNVTTSGNVNPIGMTTTLPPLLQTTAIISNSTSLMPRDTNNSTTSASTATMELANTTATTTVDHTATCTALTCTFGLKCPCLVYLDGTVWKTNNLVASENMTTLPAATEDPFAFVMGPSRWSRLLLAPFELDKTVNFIFDYQLSLLNGSSARFSVFAKRNDSIVENSLVTPDLQNSDTTWRNTSAILLPGPYEYIAFEVKNLASDERVAIDSTRLLPIFDLDYCPPKTITATTTA